MRVRSRGLPKKRLRARRHVVMRGREEREICAQCIGGPLASHRRREQSTPNVSRRIVVGPRYRVN
jgi:hypothetical protein